jgi:regulator of sigma E protease
MSIIIFIAVLVLLILVHELGHFLAAKYFNIKAEEFGIGFPPRLKTLFWWGETRFTLNAIPFGGFVKIFGEDPTEESIEGPDKERSFVNKNRAVQAVVLFSGVFFNALLAVLFIFFAFYMGIPVSEGTYDSKYIEDSKVTVMSVLEDSPAYLAGLEIRDEILSVKDAQGEEMAINGNDDLTFFLSTRGDEDITIYYERDGVENEVTVVAQEGLIEDGVPAIGVGVVAVGLANFPIHVALLESVKHSIDLVALITVELSMFIVNIFTGSADFSEIAGPVGIVGLVGDAWDVGFAYLLYFTAVISLHLAVINLLPFPALDGGRLLFVGIESVTRRAIKPQIANALNGLGFNLLILLMIVVTLNDFSRLFG